MTDEVEQSVNQEEVAPPTNSEEQQDSPQETAQEVQDPPIKDQEYNWREARRKIDELEYRTRQQDDLISKLQNQKTVAPQEDDLAKLAEDDIITVKQAKNIGQKMAREVAEQVIREREAATVDERVKNRFPDFYDIVTKENFGVLQQQDPELAQSIVGLAHDPYAQAVAAYKLLKKQGFGEMAKNQPQKNKALENSRKPVSVQSVTKSSAIGEVHRFENGLTPELKKELWKEMQQAMKGT